VSYPFPEGKHENPEKIQRTCGGKMILQYLPAVTGCGICVLVGLFVGIAIGREINLK
jgi:hypothetical protein